jgi:competence protein ComEA
MDMNFSRFLRFSEMDKKLLIKVIAGILLLATAFVFYLIKDSSEEQSKGISVSADTVIESSGEAISPEAVENMTIMVDVAGAVTNPCVVSLPEGSRVFQAAEKAGGFTSEADLTVINQAEILSDGQKLYIPTKKEVAESLNESSASDSSTNSSTHSVSGESTPAYQAPTYSNGTNSAQSKININSADSSTLQQLSGVGPTTAEKIITYRNENGRFKTIEDIKNVSGIGDKTFEKFKNKITV